MISTPIVDTPTLATPTDEQSPDESVWFALSESEITESEGNEDGEAGRDDLACVFDRRDGYGRHLKNFEIRPFAVSNRFSNPCEIFRVLRC